MVYERQEQEGRHRAAPSPDSRQNTVNTTTTYGRRRLALLAPLHSLFARVRLASSSLPRPTHAEQRTDHRDLHTAEKDSPPQDRNCTPAGTMTTALPDRTRKESIDSPSGHQTQDDNVPSPPPSQFISHLAKNPDTPYRQLLEPYLAYELQLRKDFAQDGSQIADLANLVKVFDGEEGQFIARCPGRYGPDKDKFIMSWLNEEFRLPLWHPRSMAIVPSFDEYKVNFESFTHSSLAGLDWSNIVAAGSSAMLPLLIPDQDILDEYIDPTVQDPLEAYYQWTAASSDIDLFIYGLDQDAAIEKITQIEATIRQNQRMSRGTAMTLRTANALTFVSPRWPYRHVQIILRLYKSISEILTGFDVDCACVAFDGSQVYTNPRGVAALATRTNLIDLSRRSPSYENRLYKYRCHGFDTYWDQLDRSRVNKRNCHHDDTPWDVLKGLALLLTYERLASMGTLDYGRKRTLKAIEETGPTASAYASIELPYGERMTTARTKKFFSARARESYAWGRLEKVIEGLAETRGRNAQSLATRLQFITDNPGRQMIGSFHPLTADDWTEVAYNPETYLLK